MAKRIRHVGAIESGGTNTSYTDSSGAYMDYDGSSYAQFGAKASASGSLGVKIRTMLSGVVKDAIAIAASGLLITLLAGSTLAAQAVTGTTFTGSGNITSSAGNFVLSTNTAGLFFKAASGTNPYINCNGASAVDFVLSSGVGSGIGFSVRNSALDALVTVTTGAIMDFPNGGEVRISGTKVVSGRRTGWTAASGTATRTTFDTASVTLSRLAESVKALIDDGIAFGWMGA